MARYPVYRRGRRISPAAVGVTVIVVALVAAANGRGSSGVTHASTKAAAGLSAAHPAHPAAPASGPTAADLIHAEKKKLGLPYVYGAVGPYAYDCSGLIWTSLQQIGIDVGADQRTSEDLYAWTIRISYSQLEPGDLIFEQWPNDPDPDPGHVLTYEGGGYVIEAPHTGAYVQVRRWSPTETHITGYGRIPGLRY